MRWTQSAKSLLRLLRLGVAALLPGTAHALTGPVAYQQGFEEALTNWTLDPPWGVTTEDHAGGTHGLTDSPGGPYANNVAASATVQLDLHLVNRPALTFAQRYNLEDNADFGYAEVSTDGTNWQRLFFVTGSSNPTWSNAQIDLSEYGHSTSPVSLRFRLITNDSGVFDGWYIDDVRIIDNTTTLSYPFTLDDMETTASDSKWISSAWERVATDGHSGTHSWTASPNVPSVFAALVLAGTIDLSDPRAVNPQLSFWHSLQLGATCSGGAAQVALSEDGGLHWTPLATYWPPSPPWGCYPMSVAREAASEAASSWAPVQIDLTRYAGLSNVLVRFTVAGDGIANWAIDDVLIDEACQSVFLNPPTYVAEHSMTLTWDQSACPDFQQ